jgi:hypothetical protein
MLPIYYEVRQSEHGTFLFHLSILTVHKTTRIRNLDQSIFRSTESEADIITQQKKREKNKKKLRIKEKRRKKDSKERERERDFCPRK